MVLKQGCVVKKRRQNLREWHLWFAWYPVKVEVSGDLVWLETVHRRLGQARSQVNSLMDVWKYGRIT